MALDGTHKNAAIAAKKQLTPCRRLRLCFAGTSLVATTYHNNNASGGVSHSKPHKHYRNAHTSPPLVSDMMFINCPSPLHTVIVPALDDEWPENGMGPLSAIVAIVPDPSAVPVGEWIAIGTGETPPPKGWLQRLKYKKRWVHRAIRCTALLAKGYVEVGAGVNDEGTDLAWGRSPQKEANNRVSSLAL